MPGTGFSFPCCLVLITFGFQEQALLAAGSGCGVEFRYYMSCPLKAQIHTFFTQI